MCRTEPSKAEVTCDRRNSAMKFVDNLVNDGLTVRCDSTNEDFCKGMNLPNFYDDKKFKRGQKFFHDHIFAMFYAKLLGLVADLSMSFAYDILDFTNKSNCPLKAYKRYCSTIVNMYTWYCYDLQPGSISWLSLNKLRMTHSAASRKSCESKIGEISQCHMALAQFGFMGFITSRSNEIGIFNASEEEMEGFVHFWRVIGHMLGIEDRFNICRETVEETQEICEEVMTRIVNPSFHEGHPIFLKMASALVQGMWAMMPFLNTKVWLNIVYDLLNRNGNNNNNQKLAFLSMNVFEKILYHFVNVNISLMRYKIFRLFFRRNMHFILYVTQKFPFLAYYKYGVGYEHTSYVKSLRLKFF